MDLLPLAIAASACLLFSLGVFFLRDRLQAGRTPARTTGNELPLDRAP